MLRLAPAALVALSLALAGCGGDDGEEPASGASGETGEEAPADITAGEFLEKLGPEKEIALEGIVATSPECETAKVDSSLLLLVSDAASDADPDEPLTPIVESQC